MTGSGPGRAFAAWPRVGCAKFNVPVQNLTRVSTDGSGAGQNGLRTVTAGLQFLKSAGLDTRGRCQPGARDFITDARLAQRSRSRNHRENGPTQLRRSGIFPRWTNVAEGYNRTTNVDWCSAFWWGSLETKPIEGLSLLGVAVEIAFLRRARGLHLYQPSEDGAAKCQTRFRHMSMGTLPNIRPARLPAGRRNRPFSPTECPVKTQCRPHVA